MEMHGAHPISLLALRREYFFYFFRSKTSHSANRRSIFF